MKETKSNERWDVPETQSLIDALLALRTTTEAKKFLRDLLTEQEIIEFGKRWQAAQMLYQNIPYSEIEAETGLSSATVARISRWLQEGKGGYKTLLKRMKLPRQKEY